MDYGGKVAFDLRGSQVIVTRVEVAEHEDPAMGSFLELLESDIKAGKHLTTLPDVLVQAMLSTLSRPVDLAADIKGDAAL